MSLFNRFFGCKPTGFLLRTPDGKLVALLDDRISAEILSSGTGDWVEKNFKDTGKTMVYQLQKDAQVIDLAGVRIFLWKDYYLVKNKTISE